MLSEGQARGHLRVNDFQRLGTSDWAHARCLAMLGMLLMLGGRVRACYYLIEYLGTTSAAECSALLPCLANDIEQMHLHCPQLA